MPGTLSLVDTNRGVRAHTCADRERARQRARQRAHRELARRHPGEFASLLKRELRAVGYRVDDRSPELQRT